MQPAAQRRARQRKVVFASRRWLRSGLCRPLRIPCTRDPQISIKESFHAELKAAIESEPWLAAHYNVGVDYLRGTTGPSSCSVACATTSAA